MRLRMTEDPLYKDYLANGGGLSSLYLDEGAVRAKRVFTGRILPKARIPSNIRIHFKN